MMKNLLIVILFALSLWSCKKDSNPPDIPDGNDTTAFSIPKTENIVMYEVNLRALSASGDLQGVTGRLGEIKKLGANVIWLMPIHPIGEVNSVNSPYSVRNYKEVNPEFGTLSDLQELIHEAHKIGIAIIIDWVANHTAWDNPWIVNKDWYTQDGQGNIIHPAGTNWQDVADLNYDSQEMRLAMIDAMKYWVNVAKVDGFRCDAADWIPFDFWVQAIDSVSRVNDSLIWLAEGARADHFTAGFRMNYSWNFYNRLKEVWNGSQPASSLVLVHNQEYNGLPAGMHKLRFTTNHDESAWDATPMVLFNGVQGALAASVATIFLGGVPMIYGSQEVGQVQNVPFFSNSPINWSQHPDMLKAYQDIFGIYNKSEAPRNGSLVSHSTANVLAFRRISAADEVLVIVNPKNREVNYDIAAELESTTWKDGISGSTIILPAEMDLGAFEYLILKK